MPGTGISVAGQRNLNNTFIVDGLSANDDAADLAGTYFAEEVIREFQVVTSGGIAEFGRASAGIVNIVTQSGANDARAAASTASSATMRSTRATRSRLARIRCTRRSTALSLSGPIARDRTFWFANVERTRPRAHRLHHDRAGGRAGAINGVLDAAGYRGPRVATGEFPTGYDTTNVFGRVDHAMRGATRLTARYSLYDIASDNARNVGGLNAVSRGTRLDNRDQTVALNLLTALSPARVQRDARPGARAAGSPRRPTT